MDDGQVTGQDETLPGRDAVVRAREDSSGSWLENRHDAHLAFYQALPLHSERWEELNWLFPNGWEGRVRENYCPHECDGLCNPRLDREGRLHPSGDVQHYYLPFEEESDIAGEFRPGPNDEFWGGILILGAAAVVVMVCLVALFQ